MVTFNESAAFDRNVVVFKNERGVKLEVPGECMGQLGRSFQVIEHKGDIYALPTKVAHRLMPKPTVLAIETRVVYPGGNALARTN